MCINLREVFGAGDQKDVPRSSGNDGFTLIEIMIAIVVLVFGVVSIMGVSVYVTRANNTSNTLNILAAAAQDQVDRLRYAVWDDVTEDSTITVGGSLTGSSSSSSSGTYTYTLDPSDSHHATVSGTPVGNLDIRWQVRQGGTNDLRYVTIRVVQVIPSPGLQRGFTVSTIIARQD